MAKRFDLNITSRAAYAITAKACSGSFPGTVSAMAIPLFSASYNLTFTDSGGVVRFANHDKNNVLVQYAGSVEGDLSSPVTQGSVALSTSVSGKTIVVSVPFGATYPIGDVTPEFILGAPPRRYKIEVAYTQPGLPTYSIMTGTIFLDPKEFEIATPSLVRICAVTAKEL